MSTYQDRARSVLEYLYKEAWQDGNMEVNHEKEDVAEALSDNKETIQ